MTEITVNLTWDADISVWTATSEEVTGLVLKSGSLDALIERVKYAVPELMKFNKQEISDEKLSIFFRSERLEHIV